MITWMQKHRKYLVVTIWISTIAFVGAGFVGWGQFDLNMDRSKSIAKVGERTISNREFQLSYSNLFGYYNQMLNGKMTNEKAKELGLEELVINKLIDDALLLNYADELGLITTDKEIAQTLKDNNKFHKNGVFDKEIYYNVLNSVNMKPKDYEEAIKKEILLSKLEKILNIPNTNLEMESLMAAFFIKDKIEFSIIEENPNDINISEEELKIYWEKNKNNYMTKKSYSLDTIDIFAKDMSINNEEELKEFYEKNRTKYKNKDGKISSFEDAKSNIETDYKFKKAKYEAFIKFPKFKDGEINATSKLVIFDKENDIEDMDKIREAKKDSFIKPIKLKDRYIISKLTSINKPIAMDFQAAREMTLADLKASLIKEKLKKLAIEALKNFHPSKTSDYLSRNDIDKIEGLEKSDIISFLEYLFSNHSKNGYKVFPNSNKAIVYKIIDQKINDEEKAKKDIEFIKANVTKIKENEINANIVSLLKKRYKIESYYYKGE